MHKMFKALDKQLESIASQVDELEIDIKKPEDQKLLDLVIKFSKEGKKTAESMMFMADSEEEEETALDEFDFESIMLSQK